MKRNICIQKFYRLEFIVAINLEYGNSHKSLANNF